MRVAIAILLVVTLLSVLWLLFILWAASFGFADTLYGSFREQLAAEVGWDRANHITGLASRLVYHMVRWLVIWLGMPLIATNVAWAVFGLWYVERSRREAEVVRFASNHPATLPPGRDSA